MDLPLAISVIAAIISIGSLSIAFWATRLSKKSLEHSIDIQQRSEKKEFENSKAELLMQISDNRRVLDKTRIEIGTLKAHFDVESQRVKAIMTNYTALFDSHLPQIEKLIQVLDARWKDVSEWTQEKSHKDLMEEKALLYSDLKDNEVIYESGDYLVRKFKNRLEMVKKDVAYSNR